MDEWMEEWMRARGLAGWSAMSYFHGLTVLGAVSELPSGLSHKGFVIFITFAFLGVPSVFAVVWGLSMLLGVARGR